jgi:acyl carrier protein
VVRDCREGEPVRADDRQVLDAIQELVGELLGFDGLLRPEQRLAEDLELDSLKTLTLAVEVENRFRICLDPDSEAQIVTVGDLVATVRRKLDERSCDAD